MRALRRPSDDIMEAYTDDTDDDIQALLEWIDSVPLSRPKKNLSRDFADGVLMAELVHHYFPRLVELHNYSAAHSTAQKQYNWTTLNQKVFRRLGFALAREQCEAVASAEPGAIERVLKLARARMARFQEGGSRAGTGGADTSGSASSSQPGSPVCAAAVESPPVAAADSIAALRLAAEVPAKLGGAQPYAAALATTSAPFGTPDQALAASLADKEAQLAELRETNEILETKVRKLEQLVRLKDAKIQALLAKLQAAQGV